VKAALDFNYKVALASGLRSLQAGRLRQAEEQFRYLTTRFPSADGGYRGLAKVLIESEDRDGAAATLRDGAAACARAGQRVTAIALLREAVGLDPRDRSTHRHLAAALQIAGQPSEAATEHERWIDLETRVGDPDLAKRELIYALQTIHDSQALLDLAERLGVDADVYITETIAPDTDASSEARAEDGGGVEVEEGVARGDEEGAPSSQRHPALGADGEARGAARDPARGNVDAAATRQDAVDAADARLAAVAPVAPSDPEAHALRLIATRDPQAAEAALAAAKGHLEAGRHNAASDLLLHLVASRLSEHEAQRLLVDVAKALGKKDVARAKCGLLAHALRLEGQPDLAQEVERLAQAV
jgi:thioredoxin-like negative regulator of GroEL